MAMIDLTRIRSIKILEDMKKDCEFFFTDPIVKEIYLDDYKWGEEDLEADREDAAYLIERIDTRIKSLSKMKEHPPKEKKYKKLEPVSEPPVSGEPIDSSPTFFPV